MAIKVLLKDTSSFKEDFIQKNILEKTKQIVCVCVREKVTYRKREKQRERQGKHEFPNID